MQYGVVMATDQTKSFLMGNQVCLQLGAIMRITREEHMRVKLEVCTSL